MQGDSPRIPAHFADCGEVAINVGNLDVRRAKGARHLLGRAEHRAVFAHVGPGLHMGRRLASINPGAPWATEGRRVDAA